MRLQVFQDICEIDGVDDLRERLNYRHQGKFGAFWLCRDEPELGLFINGEQAWLYYMPPDQDGMISSVNKKAGVPSEKEVEFVLENYEYDPVPATMVVDVKPAIEAFVDYYANGKIGNQICWE